MLDLSLDLKKDSDFLRTRKTLTVSAELRPSQAGGAIPISAFIERLFTTSPNFIPAECFHVAEPGAGPVLLEDMRGRPYDEFPESEQSALENLRRAQEEEIFFGGGALIDTEDEVSEGATPHEQPFFLRITSKFETFKGDKHIVYRIQHSESPALEEIRPNLSARLLARLLPLRLDKIRLGLESYRSSTLGSIFGMVPAVQDRLFLEITSSSIRVTASCDYRGKQPSLPFEDQQLMAHLDTALRECNLFPDLMGRISTELASK
ncbi:MAG: hypothetical protein U0136_07270 [Bdellovibrionota bacterium]